MKLTKKQLDELVGGDITSTGGDRNATGDSEIETGPVDKPYNDNSEYEKGFPTTGDKVFSRYRQNIPWFAVYTFGGNRTGLPIFGLSENKNKLTKQNLEELIEDLVKKSKDNDLSNNQNKIDDLVDKIEDMDLTKKELKDLLNKIKEKRNI